MWCWTSESIYHLLRSPLLRPAVCKLHSILSFWHRFYHQWLKKNSFRQILINLWTTWKKISLSAIFNIDGSRFMLSSSLSPIPPFESLISVYCLIESFKRLPISQLYCGVHRLWTIWRHSGTFLIHFCWLMGEIRREYKVLTQTTTTLLELYIMIIPSGKTLFSWLAFFVRCSWHHIASSSNDFPSTVYPTRKLEMCSEKDVGGGL